jgi:hypothetical protein
MMIKTFLAAVLLAAATAATASWFTGNDLLRHLNGEPFERGGAAGFITGVASAIDGDIACIPPEVTVAQMRDMVHQQLRATPNVRHEAAEIIVAAVLMNEFPCKNVRPGSRKML